MDGVSTRKDGEKSYVDNSKPPEGSEKFSRFRIRKGAALEPHPSCSASMGNSYVPVDNVATGYFSEDLGHVVITKPASGLLPGKERSEYHIGQPRNVTVEIKKEKPSNVNTLLEASGRHMSATEFDQLLKGLISDIDRMEKGFVSPFSTQKKIAFGVALTLCFVGASSSLAGLIPLGADATPRERKLGIIKFIFGALLNHGAVYTHSMASILTSLDERLSSDRRENGGGCLSKILSDFKQRICGAQCQDVVPTVMAVGIALYSPMLDALNSRLGVLNLVTLGSSDPSLIAKGKALGNVMMGLNWLAGACLPLIMARSLFDGYVKVMRELLYGARDQREKVNKLTAFLELALNKLHQQQVSTEKSLTNEDIEQILNENNLNMGFADYSPQALKKEMEQLLLSPLLAKKVLKKLAGQPVEYNNALVRMNAAGILTFRLLICWSALNGLAVTFAAPMVVGHYKAYMENPTLDVDCHYLRNISDTIEPFDNNLFQSGIVAYLAQGLALSDAGVGTFQTLLIPLAFIASGCNLENLNRALRFVSKLFDTVSILGLTAALMGTITFLSIINGAGDRYGEYLDLLDCDIDVPESPMVVEFKSAALVTEVMMCPIVFNINYHVWTSIFKMVVNRVKRCRAGWAATQLS